MTASSTTEFVPTGFSFEKPRLLFFSGGTALKETSRELARHTSNTIHLITPFDSGGSSAALRRAFTMPAVGDIRSRLMALADQTVPGTPEVFTLCSYRFQVDALQGALRRELGRMVDGSHVLLRQIPMPMREQIQGNLAWVSGILPDGFPLRGASIGNLLLTADYLRHGRKLAQAIDFYAEMVRAKGIVLPVAESSAHLAVRLISGEEIVGQHRFTGKETAAITSPIKDLWLAEGEKNIAPACVSINARVQSLILSAGCICYPIGSFYSSVVANLLPAGVGRAVAANPCPKIFVPNLGTDPELAGHTVQLQIERLVRPLLADAPGAAVSDMLDTLLADTKRGTYPGGIPANWLKKQGIRLVHAPLVTDASAPLVSSGALARELLLFTGLLPS